MLGFTLIELMIVVVVVAVLSMVAMPTYLDSVRKSRRSEAISALTAVQQAQERWRANCPTYTADISLPVPASAATMCANTAGLGQPATTSSGRYAIANSGVPTGSFYAVTATAVAGKGQEGDKAQGTSCATLTLAASAGTWSATPAQCWSR